MHTERRSEAAPPKKKAETELAPDDPQAEVAEIKTPLLFIIGSLIIGLLLGGRELGVRSVLGQGAAQRNVAAAIVVNAQNFSGSNTLVLMLVAAILGLLILMPTARHIIIRWRLENCMPHGCDTTTQGAEAMVLSPRQKSRL